MHVHVGAVEASLGAQVVHFARDVVRVIGPPAGVDLVVIEQITDVLGVDGNSFCGLVIPVAASPAHRVLGEVLVEA